MPCIPGRRAAVASRCLLWLALAGPGLLVTACSEAPGADRPPRELGALPDRGAPGDGRPDRPSPASDGGSPPRDGGASADRAADLPPAGSCTVDAHCATIAGQPLCESGACVACGGGSDAATFVDENVPDGTTFRPGEGFFKRWGLRNSGSSSWSGPCGYRLAHVEGPTLGAGAPLAPADLERVAAGSKKDWTMPLRAPNTPGKVRGYFRMSRDGAAFGDKVWVEIVVSACGTHADCRDPAAGACQADGSCAAPACTADAQCTDPQRPFCAQGQCVGCKTGSDCPPALSTCQQGTCIDPNACGQGPKPTLATTVWPVPAKKTLCQGFGNPISYQSCGFHTGVDICVADGADILALAAGKVVHVGYLWLNGATTGRGPYAIIVQHAPNYFSTYSHNRKALVAVGDCVAAGQQIAEIGNLGYSGGPHLHLKVLDGTPYTGNWQQPFANACSYYLDPMKLIAP